MSRSAICLLVAPENPCKVSRALHHMATGNTLSAFDAASLFQDHALNSSINEIVQVHGVVIEKTRAPFDSIKVSPAGSDHYTVVPHPANLQRCLLALQSMGYKSALLPDSHKGMGAGHGSKNI